MKRIIVAIAIGLMPFCVLAQSKPQASKTPAPKPADEGARLVATINGEKLTVDDLNYLWNSLPEQMRKSYEVNGGGKIGFLDNYIERRLIVQQASKESFDKRPDVALEIEHAKESALFNEYVSKVVAADAIPPNELHAYYDSHKSEFARPLRAKARHIVATPVSQPVYNTADDDAKTDAEAHKKMETILQQLRANPSISNFSDLAGKYSEDASSKSGGDLGWVPQGMLSPALDEALFKLKPGQISDVVKTEFGYHVIICEGIEPAGTAPFEDVKEEVVKKLLVQKQPQVIAALKALVQDLRRASAITIYRENL